MTIEQIRKVATLLDLPSGVVMSVWTLSMIGVSWLAVIKKADIPTTVVTLYGMGLGAFSLHKTSTAITTIVNEQTNPETPKQ